MNIALFGGTFDPVHRGHLAVAKAAQRRFDLHQVLFVPAYISPLKRRQPVTPLLHRYAMVALATQQEKSFIPSLLEAPKALGGTTPNQLPSYTLDTITRFKQTLGPRDRLFFLIGIDAFLDIGRWHQPEALLAAVEFVVVSRPGFSLGDVARALPLGSRPVDNVARAPAGESVGDIVLRNATIHLLSGVQERISATQVRSAARAGGRGLGRLVGSAVAEYIRKVHLYR